MEITATATYTPRDDMGHFIQAHVIPEVLAAAEASGKIVLERAQELVPVRTGELRDSGHVVVKTTEHTAVATVVFDAEHAGYVEFGTGIMGASSAGKGPYPYNMAWHGMPAQPYLRPALHMSYDEITGEFSLRFRG